MVGNHVMHTLASFIVVEKKGVSWTGVESKRERKNRILSIQLLDEDTALI